MEKLKWGSCDQSFERDRAHGFSWPQRNYRCSFCKKEFKSAQALGGHMNVHRRYRARLRLSSPPPPPPEQNPNPIPAGTTNPSFSLKPMFLVPCNSFRGGGDSSGHAVVGESKKNKVGRVWKPNEVIRLDLNLNLGLVQDHDLDLELRLGYSN